MAVDWSITLVVEIVVILVLLVAPILWLTSSSFQYFCKMVIVYASFGVAACVTIPCAIFRPFSVENHRFLWPITRWVNNQFRIRWEVRHAQRLQSPEPCVVVLNHQSSLDCYGVMEMWPLRGAVMMKSSLRYAGPFGVAATLCGSVFIDRFHKETALATMAKATDYVVREKLKLLIFPEGTRNREGGILPFKKGAFHLAVQAQLPIVPVVFSDYSPFYSKAERRFLQGGYVIVSVLDQIETRGLTAADVTELAERTRERMDAELKRTSAEADDVMRKEMPHYSMATRKEH